MNDKQLVRFATEFRKGILGRKRRSADMCFAVCAPLVTLLSLHGVRAELVETDLEECQDVLAANHFWLRLSDGRALDPTADQFDGLGLPAVYLGAPRRPIHHAKDR